MLAQESPFHRTYQRYLLQDYNKLPRHIATTTKDFFPHKNSEPPYAIASALAPTSSNVVPP